MNKGFYIAREETNAFGFSFATVYLKDGKIFRLA